MTPFRAMSVVVARLMSEQGEAGARASELL